MQIKSVNFNINYWIKDKIEFAKTAFRGKLSIFDHKIVLNGKEESVEIPFSELIEYDLRKLYSIGTYVHLKTNDQTLNFFIPRINIADWFFIINSYQTKKIFEIIKNNIPSK